MRLPNYSRAFPACGYPIKGAQELRTISSEGRFSWPNTVQAILYETETQTLCLEITRSH